MYKEFDLVTYVANKGVKTEQKVDDETLPLHYFGLENNVKLHVMGPYLIVTSENPFGEASYHKVSNKCTVSELKEVIMGSRCDDSITDISMFVTCGEGDYKKVDSTKSITVYDK